MSMRIEIATGSHRPMSAHDQERTFKHRCASKVEAIQFDSLGGWSNEPLALVDSDSEVGKIDFLTGICNL